MKLVLPETLHARPADLLVRLSSKLHVAIEVRSGDRRADAKKILQILALGAVAGDEIEVVVTGGTPDEVAHARAAIEELIRGRFDRDLVPETADALAEGVAIGLASVIAHEAVATSSGDPVVDREHLRSAIARVEADLAELVRVLPKAEAELFAPERAIVSELEIELLRRIDEGASIADALSSSTAGGSSDLIADARARIIAALSGADVGRDAARIAELGGERMVVVEGVTPSLVAALPDNVVGVLAARGDDDEPLGFTSHAAILARGRGLPLVFVPSHVAASIVDDDVVVIDAEVTPASVWVSPGEALIARARARKAELQGARRSSATKAAAPLTHLNVAVRVNVGSLRDAIPDGAEGVGLLRTELIFADRATAPDERAQVEAIVAVSQRVRGVIVARLFDAGGDKPLPWLTPPRDERHARGVGLLLLRPDVLRVQLAAIAKSAEKHDVRALLPLTRSAADVRAVRAMLPPHVKVGAMIETPEAVADVDAIAEASDFVCIGTNDLAASTLGVSRAGAVDALDRRVLSLVGRTVERAHAHRRAVTVCGEIAGDPRGAMILIGLGVDALSVAPSRFVALKVALSAVTLDECRARAASATIETP